MRGSLVVVLVVGCSNPGPPDVVVDAPSVEPDAPRPVDGMTVVDPCFPDPYTGHVLYACNGIEFDVEVPAGCVGGGCGIILDVHGLTMSAEMEDANTELRSRGAAAGFIVVQPSANPAPPQARWTADDEPRVYDFLTRAIAVYGVDPDRVHMTGFSQGGFMTWRFVCQHADLFASVAPAAAATNCGAPACSFTGSELPSRQLDILYMHGSADHNYIPFGCAQPQVEAIVGAWGLADQGVIASGTGFTRRRYANANATLEFLVHDYSSNAQVPLVSASKLQGHCYPGSTDDGGAPGQLFPFRCEQPAGFVWGNEVVSFFVAHPKH